VSLSVAFGALLVGVIVWALLVSKLTVKPWEAKLAPDGKAQGGLHGTLGDGIGAEEVVSPAAAKIGLWTFLAVVTALFGLFISAYLMRRGHGPMGQTAAGPAPGSAAGAVAQSMVGEQNDWHSLPLPPILWLNTAVLILGSVAMQWGRLSVRRGQAAGARRGFVAGGLLTLVFLVGQLLAWRQLGATALAYGYCGTYAGSSTPNPLIPFFYLLTAVHGLHLLGGLFVWGRTAARMGREGTELIDVRSSIDLCTDYWHYLLFVWLVLFGLLLTT